MGLFICPAGITHEDYAAPFPKGHIGAAGLSHSLLRLTSRPFDAILCRADLKGSEKERHLGLTIRQISTHHPVRLMATVPDTPLLDVELTAGHSLKAPRHCGLTGNQHPSQDCENTPR